MTAPARYALWAACALAASPLGCKSERIESDYDPDGTGGEDYGCIVGERNCECAMEGACDPSLACVDDLCVEGGDSLESTAMPDSGDGDGDAGDGDGDSGDGDSGDGDGDSGS